MSEGDVALACASLLVDELVHGGMTDACLSPGSRSTAIALALARHPGVRVHVHLDERASAFFALGLAKANRGPVAVACTSGTAATNLFPAIVEASMSRTPLMALTADRPPELRGTGANQTIDQENLYGRYVRWFVDAPVPSSGAGAVWRALGANAIERSVRHPPGPVHLNLPFVEPLFPTGGEAPVEDPGPVLDQVALVRIIQEDREPIDPPLIERFRREVEGVDRGAIVIGSWPDGVPEGVTRLGHRLGWPVIAEPTSQGREPGGLTLSAGQALLSCAEWLSDHRPGLVLQVGATPTTRATQAFVASAERLIVVDDFYPEPDPGRHATWRIHTDASALAGEIGHRISPRASSSWLDDWRLADDRAREAIDDLLDAWDEPFEGRVARDLAAWIREGVLVVGSSMPIRDLDYYMAPRDGLRVLANRGASGIDGFVSTALGVAASGAPTFALLGDLTLLHDAGSLLWSARRGYDAVFVVLNNDGGAIFSFLPGQRDLPEHVDLFVTPHGLELATLAETAGAGYERIEQAGDLVPAVQRASEAGGTWLVEVPSDRERNRERHADVRRAVAMALERR